ncbi:MAG: hypothetical protein V3U13_07355 [Gemmatimonadota bacterium]
MKKWAIYAGTSALLVSFSALLIGFTFEPPARLGIWAGLASAWLVQAVAFAALVAAAARRDKLIVAGWTVGTVLRLAALGLLAWLTLGGITGLPAEPTLIALALALFALLLLEPIVFRYGFGAG